MRCGRVSNPGYCDWWVMAAGWVVRLTWWRGPPRSVYHGLDLQWWRV